MLKIGFLGFSKTWTQLDQVYNLNYFKVLYIEEFLQVVLDYCT